MKRKHEESGPHDTQLLEGVNKKDDLKDEEFSSCDEHAMMDIAEQMETDCEERKTESKRKFVCDECGKFFVSMQKLVKHKLAHVLILTCELCGRNFSRKENLTRHKKNIHNMRKKKTVHTTCCEICGKQFSTHKHLKRHVSNVHKRDQQSTEGGNRFKCRHCHQGFGDYESLFNHVDTDHPLNQRGGRMETRPKSPLPLDQTNASMGQHTEDDNSGDKAVFGENHTQEPNNISEIVDESALQNGVRNRYIFPRLGERYDVLTFFANIRSKIKELLQSRLKKTKGIKWNLCIHVEMEREGSDGDVTSSPYFRSGTYILLDEDTFSEHALNEALQKMHASMEKYLREGSGWYVKKVIKLDLHTVIFKPISGSSYIALPNTLLQSRSVLNIENTDDKCFIWCILASLHSTDKSPTNVDHYQPFENELNMTGIDYPVKLSDLNKFEQQNSNISVNVFGFEDREIIPLRISEQSDRLHHVNLLYLKRKNISHYCLITNLNRFLSRTKSTNSSTHFCPFCLHGFVREDSLKQHRTLCCVNGEQKIELPTEGEDDILEFKQYEKTLKVPFTIYADFETINRKLHSCSPNPEKASTSQTTKLEVCSFGYKVQCINSRYSKPTRIFRGDNAASKLIECLLEEQKEIEDILSSIEPMVLTEEDIQNAEKTTSCCICNKDLHSSDQKVRHHNHVTGSFIGIAHNQCNLNCKQVTFIPVIFHNLKGFDAHILCESIGLFKKQQLKCIAQNTEKYVSFSLGKLRFLDSLQFLNSSLETLVDNLVDGMDDGHGNKIINVQPFTHLIEEFPLANEVKLLLRKGVYPYDYMDDEERFHETELPPKEAFYSTIAREHISDKDYAHAQEVYKTFNLQNLGEYHDLYLKSDVLNLCCVFEKFRDVCLNQYRLDPCHFYTSPGLAWVSCLKMTGVSLELMKDIDQILFIERGIRGGISQVSNRFVEANNPLLDNYDSSKPLKWAMYYDVNNLYGFSMLEKLPTGFFRFLDAAEIQNFDVEKIPEDGDRGYILEVSLRYPEHLHDSHNDYPLAPERKCIDNEMLSPYAQHLWKRLHGKSDDDVLPPRPKVEKLLCTLEDKDNYIVHYRNLQLYLKLGMEIKQIHRVLEFRQEAWMSPFISHNTQMRQKARSAFEKSFYKLMNNSVFGKTMENVRKHKDIELVHTRKRLGKVAAKSTYKTSKIFSEDLVAVELALRKVKLYKPSYSGMCILELSKLLMYDFYYNHLKKKYYTRLRLDFTDTDSFLFHCECDNVYDDMKEHADLFDTSDYPKDHPLHSDKNKKVVGKMKDECNGVPISAFVGLRSKMYAFKCGRKVEKRAKGIAKVTVKKDLKFEHYKETLFTESRQLSSMSSIRSHSHQLYVENISKTGLSSFDDKRYLLNAVDSYAYGHYKIKQSQ